MTREWTPLLLPPEQAAASGSRVALNVSELSATLTMPPSAGNGAVRQVRYGINDIEYQVSLTAPRLLVENEMYFPGWRARFRRSGEAEIEADAVEVNGVFRGWRLPAGEYAMTASFGLPHLFALRLVAVVSMLIWINAWAGLPARLRFGRYR
jgi:hypothetical protein